MAETRKSFLDRVRAALRAGSWPEPPRAAVPPLQTAAPDSDWATLAATFAEALLAVGGYVHWSQSLDDAVAQSIAIAHSLGVQSIIVTRHTEMLRFPTALAGEGFRVTVVGFVRGETPTPELRAEQKVVMAQADLVISGVDYGIAETGTIALVAGPHNPRTATLLPPVHIAVLDPRNIVPAMPELIGRYKVERLDENGRFDVSALTFITGPSRTGDIERTLSVGVHGPGEVHVILLPTEP